MCDWIFFLSPFPSLLGYIRTQRQISEIRLQDSGCLWRQAEIILNHFSCWGKPWLAGMKPKYIFPNTPSPSDLKLCYPTAALRSKSEMFAPTGCVISYSLSLIIQLFRGKFRSPTVEFWNWVLCLHCMSSGACDVTQKWYWITFLFGASLDLSDAAKVMHIFQNIPSASDLNLVT